MSTLLSSYPDMDTDQLQDTLTKAFLIADLAGQGKRSRMWQMASPDIGFAVNLKPEEAIRYFESKGLKLTKSWNELWQAAHTKAFTVAHVAKMDVLLDIHTALRDALHDGMTEQAFMDALIQSCKPRAGGVRQLIKVQGRCWKPTPVQASLGSTVHPPASG